MRLKIKSKQREAHGEIASLNALNLHSFETLPYMVNIDDSSILLSLT